MNSLPPQKTNARTAAGYSLVEVTLALLVVAIGLTSTFALFPEAMRNTRAAVDDTEVALFADYVFSTLAVVAAAPSSRASDDDTFDFNKTDIYASMVLTDKDEQFEKVSLEKDTIDQFYWIPRDEDMGTGTWELAKDAGYWSTAFTYRLTIGDRNKGKPKKTKYAKLEVWPGEWKTIADEKAFKPYVFYREILPYPNL